MRLCEIRDFQAAVGGPPRRGPRSNRPVGGGPIVSSGRASAVVATAGCGRASQRVRCNTNLDRAHPLEAGAPSLGQRRCVGPRGRRGSPGKGNEACGNHHNP